VPVSIASSLTAGHSWSFLGTWWPAQIGRRIRHDVGPRAGEWLITLASFEIKLYCNGQLIDRGHALNILDGPLSALRHLVELLSRDPDNPPLAAGEIVATGTLTRALAVKAGETWTTKLSDIALKGIAVRFC
jgi:2-keto-4-pentenoate hydratase